MGTESVLITGTTSGIGRGLLEHYAASGAKVIAVNRRRDPELEARHPSVRFECADVRSAEDVARLLSGLGELPEVFILNAGVNLVDNDEVFDLDAYKTVLETNLFGVLNFIQPLTRLPAGRAPRHVVAIGSLSGYVGNPYGLGYHTSKRALTACFEVWSEMYTGTDLIFQSVMLGPVRTTMYTMADKFPAWMVWLKQAFSASLGGTVQAIAAFATTRRQRLFYPWQAVPLYFGMWFTQRLVPGFFRGRKTRDGNRRRTSR